jgi:micrococcal nuclease
MEQRHRIILTAAAVLVIVCALGVVGCAAGGSTSSAPAPGAPTAAAPAEPTAAPTEPSTLNTLPVAPPGKPPEPRPRPRPPVTTGSPVRLVAVTVVRITDGDTVRVRMPDGTIEKVRFIGVDTPEKYGKAQPYGREASAYTKKRLDGRKVWLQIGTEPRDRYERLLAYIWLAPPRNLSDAELRAKLFNAQLVIEGYAMQLTYPPNVEYVDALTRFVREARAANRGLWAIPGYKEGVYR